MSHYTANGKLRREWLRAHHLCIDCKQKDAYTIAGKCRCFDCSEKARLRDSGREVPRKDWIEMGLCIRCGNAPPVPGLHVCEECREFYKQMSAKSHEGHPPRPKRDGRPNPPMLRSDWVKNGFCWKCGEPITDKRLKVCEACHQQCIRAQLNTPREEMRERIKKEFLIGRLKKNDRSILCRVQK